MSNPIGPAPAIDLTSAKAGDPLPTGVGLRLVEIAGVLNATTDGVTFVPVGTGGSWTPDGVTLTGAGTVGSPAAVKVPLSLTTTATGFQPVLILGTTDTSTGSPVLQFFSGATEMAHIRTDHTGVLTICSQVLGAVCNLVAPQETAIRFTWNLAGISFFGGTVAAKQAIGVSLTNGATGGTASTVSTFAGSVYATDAPIILGNLNQLAIKLNLLDAALKAYTLCSN